VKEIYDLDDELRQILEEELKRANLQLSLLSVELNVIHTQSLTTELRKSERSEYHLPSSIVIIG
jgi:hypothetical protein